jgi:predicted MFS family arabinose efflux permease
MQDTTIRTFSESSTVSGSERFILLILTAIQFTNILDFVIVMPLGPQLMRVFSIFGGCATIISSRVIGKLADRYGKVPVFTFVALLSMVPIPLVTNLPPVSLPVAIVVLTLFMVLVSGRMVPSMAMVTATVHPKRRGSFLSINSSVQQLAAGLASFGAGMILGKSPNGAIANFGTVGLVSVLTTIACIWLARNLKPVDSTHREIYREAVVGAE